MCNTGVFAGTQFVLGMSDGTSQVTVSQLQKILKKKIENIN
jgi:hypothetical protein